MRRTVQVAVIGLICCFSSLAYAQYEAEAFIEGFIGGNFTLPTGTIKNDLIPKDLNATTGVGLDLGAGYFFKPQIVGGVYFNARSMGTEGEELHHRVFEVGAYGKYFLSDVSATSFSPYGKLLAGLSFSKLATKVNDHDTPVLRELSYKPTLGVEGAVGIHYRTNSAGGLYAEVGYHLDFMDGVKGTFQGIDYSWKASNKYIILKAGVQFNIGRKG